jgi:hypothetical protein
MRRTAAVLVLAAAGSLFAAVTPASACVGEPCDVVNAVCQITKGRPCVR